MCGISVAEDEVGTRTVSAALKAVSIMGGFPDGQSMMENSVLSRRALIERALTAWTVNWRTWPFSSAIRDWVKRL